MANPRVTFTLCARWCHAYRRRRARGRRICRGVPIFPPNHHVPTTEGLHLGHRLVGRQHRSLEEFRDDVRQHLKSRHEGVRPELLRRELSQDPALLRVLEHELAQALPPVVRVEDSLPRSLPAPKVRHEPVVLHPSPGSTGSGACRLPVARKRRLSSSHDHHAPLVLRVTIDLHRIRLGDPRPRRHLQPGFRACLEPLESLLNPHASTLHGHDEAEVAVPPRDLFQLLQTILPLFPRVVPVEDQALGMPLTHLLHSFTASSREGGWNSPPLEFPGRRSYRAGSPATDAVASFWHRRRRPLQ